MSAKTLRSQFRPMLRGVWWFGDEPPELTDWIAAALLVLRHDVVVSHLTALRLHGVEIGPMLPMLPVHLTHGGLGRTQLPAVALHRCRAPLDVVPVVGFAVTSAARAFVDSATLLSLRDLVRVGDALVRAGSVTLTELVDRCASSASDGARRARRAVHLVRERVDSFRETDVRLLLGFAGLPQFDCNVKAHDVDGTFLGRGDLVLVGLKVVVEYDGWHHERSAAQ